MVISVIQPDDLRKVAWDVLVSVCVVLAVIIAPLTIALRLELTGPLLVADTVLNLVFFADILIHFNTGYVTRRRLVTDRALIRKQYLKGLFWADALATLPLFIPAGSTLVGLTRFARFARLARLFKIFVVFRNLNRLHQTTVSSNLVRLLIMVFWLLMTAHLIACGMIMAGGVPEGLPPGLRFLQAYYWTITTVATVGYGDIVPDHSNALQLVFTIVAQLIGVAMYGYVIGNISSVISNLDTSKTSFMEKLERINTFMKYREVPDKVIRRVNDYYFYLWDTRHGYDETSTVAELPRSIRLELLQAIHRDVIRAVPLFRDANPALLRDVMLNLESVAYVPGDEVIHRGDTGTEMYFISRGSVDVLAADEETVLATLTEGAFFGEIALLEETQRNATIRTRDYCDLYALNRAVFKEILARHPSFAATVREIALQRGRRG
ncbi:MAG: Crp/Fnr family transcriptional regulator [Spirochaetaceae bacterium]|nr:MAG: Crp/Fnr family transcriptional regulator [Spirochaetaceae bacterium]